MDVGDAAFSVPPQQLITHDGGIIEIGAEVPHIIKMQIMTIVIMTAIICDHKAVPIQWQQCH